MSGGKIDEQIYVIVFLHMLSTIHSLFHVELSKDQTHLKAKLHEFYIHDISLITAGAKCQGLAYTRGFIKNKNKYYNN